jgi:flagellar protein FlaG
MTTPIQMRGVTPVTPAPVAAVAPPQEGGRAEAAAAIQVPRPVLQAPKENTAVPKFDPEQFQKQLEEAVERINEQVKDYGRDLGFSVDRKINAFIITVRNTNTGEVIRQIPNEVVVKFAHSMENLKGLLFNEKT